MKASTAWMKTQAAILVRIQMSKDHMVMFSLVSCWLNWTQKQYCSVVKEKQAPAMTCSGVLDRLLNQTAVTLLKSSKTWNFILLDKTGIPPGKQFRHIKQGQGHRGA